MADQQSNNGPQSPARSGAGPDASVGQRGSPPRGTSPAGSLQKSPKNQRSQGQRSEKAPDNFQDLPPNLNEEARPRADTELSNHDVLKSQHKSDLKKSTESIQNRQSALAKSQKTLDALKADQAATGSYEGLPTQGDNVLVQETQGDNTRLDNDGAPQQASPGLAKSMGGPALDDANLASGTNVNTVSNPYAQNRSLEALDQPVKVYSEEAIAEKEERDNAQLSDKRSELEALQRQKPPEKQEDLIEYLMKRLKAAEASIQVCEEVIENERGLRKESSK